MNARWYNPQVGRFLQEDSYRGELDMPWTQNRYAYVGNNPINMWDPTGNVPEWLGKKYHSEARTLIDNGYDGHSNPNRLQLKEWELQSKTYSYEETHIQEDVQARQIVNLYSYLKMTNYTYNYLEEVWEGRNLISSKEATETYTVLEDGFFEEITSARDVYRDNQGILRDAAGNPVSVTRNHLGSFSHVSLNGETIYESSFDFSQHGDRAGVMYQEVQRLTGRVNQVVTSSSSLIPNRTLRGGIGKALKGINPKQIASTGLDFIPVVGNIKSGVEALVGRDLITGDKLSSAERLIAASGIVGGGALKNSLKVGNAAVNATMGINRATPSSTVREVSKGTGNSSKWSSDKGIYSVAYEVNLPKDMYPNVSSPRHFQNANEQLYNAFQKDSKFAQQMEGLYPGINKGVQPGSRGKFSRNAPIKEVTWHHHADREGVLQLVPRNQHQAKGPIQQILHPGGRGGMENWGGRR